MPLSHGRSSSTALIVALLCAWLPASGLAAQREPLQLPRGFAIGFVAERIQFSGIDQDGLNALSLRLTGFNPDGVGNEATVGAAPAFLNAGERAFFADMDWTQGIPVGGAVVVLRAGAGLLFGGGAGPTGNLGVGLVVPLVPRVGLRVDAMVRTLLIGFPHFYSLGIGIGLLALPGASMMAGNCP